METYGLPEMPKAAALRARRGVAAFPQRGDVVLLEEPGVSCRSRSEGKRRSAREFFPGRILRRRASGLLSQMGWKTSSFLRCLLSARLSGSMARQYSRKARTRSCPWASSLAQLVVFVEHGHVRRPVIVLGPLLQQRHSRETVDHGASIRQAAPAVDARRRRRLLLVRLLLLFLAVMQPEPDQAGDDGDRRPAGKRTARRARC